MALLGAAFFHIYLTDPQQTTEVFAMKTVFAVLALALSASAPQRASAPAPEPFSIVLDYTSTGWIAQCDVGCGVAWRASFTCETACNAVVDGRGVITVGNPRPLEKFGFLLERTSDGIRASAKTGTAWTALSWSCASQPCRARITETGVALLR